jgi:hypothetical protein
MSVTFIRVVNEQHINRSILIDKIDRSQGNFEGYAQKAKQAVYVPFTNPADSTTKGYLNLVPTNEVLLSAHDGTISGLAKDKYISFAAVDSAVIAQSTISGTVLGGSSVTINGTTFESVYPDFTRVQIRNLSGVVQSLPNATFTTFTSSQIVFQFGAVIIGTPASGWQVRVQANSLFSDWATL